MPDPALALVPPSAFASDPALAVVAAADALVHASTLEEVKAIGDKAVALRAYARARGAGIVAQNAATEIILRAERRFGELVDLLPTAPPDKRGQGRRRAGVEITEKREVDSPRAEALAAAGVETSVASRCLKLAQIPEATFDAHVRATQARGGKLTRSGTIAAVSHGADYDSDSWTTPPEIVGAVRRVLGEIELDPASNDKSQRIVKAKRYYTLADDGLALTWKGMCFVNPPYAQPACNRYVAKFIEEHASGRMKKGIILLNASTDTRWWHDLARRFPVCFTIGRIGFLQPDGTKVDSNRVGQAFFAAGCGREFASIFEAGDNPIGTVVGR